MYDYTYYIGRLTGLGDIDETATAHDQVLGTDYYHWFNTDLHLRARCYEVLCEAIDIRLHLTPYTLNRNTFCIENLPDNITRYALYDLRRRIMNIDIPELWDPIIVNHAITHGIPA